MKWTHGEVEHYNFIVTLSSKANEHMFTRRIFRETFMSINNLKSMVCKYNTIKDGFQKIILFQR